MAGSEGPSDVSRTTRRRALAAVAAGIPGGLAGCTGLLDSSDVSDVDIEIRHANELVRDVDNLVVVTVAAPEDGLLRSVEVTEPEISMAVDGGEIERVFPGDFPAEVSVRPRRVSGKGVDTTITGGEHATFAVTVAPEGPGQVDFDVTIRGETGRGGGRADATTVARVVERPDGEITHEELARAATERSRLAGALAAFMDDESAFDGRARTRLQEALLTISWMGTGLLADEALATAIGLRSTAAEIVWSGLSLFVSPFEYLIDGQPPDDPTEVTTDDLLYRIAPPFYSELLSHGESLADEFVSLVLEGGAEYQAARGKAAILFHAIEAAASEEARAWRDGRDEEGRQLLANQIKMMDRRETHGADIDAIRDRLRTHEDAVNMQVVGLGEPASLGEELDALYRASLQYRRESANTPRSIREFVRGETAKSVKLLQYYDSSRRDAEQEETPKEAGSGGTWPTFQYDVRNSGYNPGAVGPKEDVRVAWTFETGDSVVSSPVIREDVLYVGSNDTKLYAIDVADGEKKWESDGGHGYVHSTPTITAGSVYFGGGDGYVYALDAESGEEQWRFHAGGFVRSSPAIYGDTLYVGSQGPTSELEARFERVFGLDAETGDDTWRFETGDRAFSSPAVSDDLVYVGSWDGNLYALDASSGEEQWRFEVGERVSSSPAAVDGTVYVSGLGQNPYVYAIDVVSGRSRWEFQTGGGSATSPAVLGEFGYVGCDDGNLYALTTENGREAWRFEAGAGIRSSPAVADGTVYFGSSDGKVYAVDAETGAEEWRVETEDGVNSSPAVVDSGVYVGSLDGTVYAIEGHPN